MASMTRLSPALSVVNPAPSSHTRTNLASAVARYSGNAGLNAMAWTSVPASHALNCSVGCTSSPPVAVRS